MKITVTYSKQNLVGEIVTNGEQTFTSENKCLTALKKIRKNFADGNGKLSVFISTENK